MPLAQRPRGLPKCEHQQPLHAPGPRQNKFILNTSADDLLTNKLYYLNCSFHASSGVDDVINQHAHLAFDFTRNLGLQELVFFVFRARIGQGRNGLARLGLTRGQGFASLSRHQDFVVTACG